MKENERDPITDKIIGSCYKVHSKLGPGFVERVYLNALKMLLNEIPLEYEEEKEFVVVFQEERVGKFRVDLLVENKIIIELKAVQGRMPKLFESQIISYLKASGLKVGLLINFGNERCEIRRLMLP